MQGERRAGGGSGSAPAPPPPPTTHPPPPQLLWFLINLTLWGGLAILAIRALELTSYTAAGAITMRLQVRERLALDRFAVYLASKHTSAEERSDDGANALVRQAWVEVDRSAEYGGAPPRVAVEYDKRSGFLLGVTITYQRRAAKR